jgi:PIF1-like helicase
MIVDEISMVGPVLFGKMNLRTQAIAAFDMKELPFGGLSVIIVGDFYQIPPVGDTSLYKGVMDRYVHKTAEFNEKDPSCPSMIGTDLFHRFKLIALNTQCRAAKDPKHGRILRLLREVSVEFPITDAVLTYLHQHVLCRNDVKQPCSEWTLAPVITTGNGERFNILLTLAIRSAITLGVPVIRWKLPLSGQGASRYNDEELDELYSQEPALLGTFVQNSSAYVKGPNVNPGKGCANGSPLTMHSLSLASREDEARIRRASPGEIVILTKAPLYVINRIMISEVEATRRPANETLVEHEAVIPLPTNSFGNRMEDVGAIGRHRAGFVRVRDHIFETGFAITFHKIQGRTIKKIILELNQRVCGWG